MDVSLLPEKRKGRRGNECRAGAEYETAADGPAADDVMARVERLHPILSHGR